jgi:iron complex transport system ATP-binding protein
MVFVLEEVAFRYPGGLSALEGVSLSIGRGELVGVVGPNGSGKTTLLRLLGGLSSPSGGSLRFLGDDMARIPRRDLARELAMVHQGEAAFFPFSVREIVAMGRFPWLGWSDVLGQRDLVAVDGALRLADLEGLSGRSLAALSGGERQRVYLARALAQEAPVLLLDEPVAHLDVSHAIAVLELVGRLHAAEGRTVVASIHDLDLAARFFPRLILLDHGRILAQGPPSAVLSGPNVRRVFGVESMMDTNPLTGTLRFTTGVTNHCGPNVRRAFGVESMMDTNPLTGTLRFTTGVTNHQC